MLRNYSVFSFFGVLAFVAVAACGGDDDEGGSGAAGSGATAGTGGAAGQAGAGATAGTGATGGTGGSAGSGATAGGAGEAGAAGTAGTSGAGGSGGGTAAACDELSIDLHAASTWYFTLADMTEHDTEPASWDLMMGKTGAGPWITLGDGVEGINLGSADAFVDVVEAPDTGYASDPDLIGGDWKTGGEGETGFTMSDNVYVLKLANDTYAKITVSSAVAGAVTIDAFHQGDGSLDLTCTKP